MDGWKLEYDRFLLGPGLFSGAINPNKYPLYKVCMGLIIKGTIPRVPPCSPWFQGVYWHKNTARTVPFLSQDQPQPWVHWAQRCQRSRRSATIPRKGPTGGTSHGAYKPRKATQNNQCMKSQGWLYNGKQKQCWNVLDNILTYISTCAQWHGMIFWTKLGIGWTLSSEVTSGCCRNKDLKMSAKQHVKWGNDDIIHCLPPLRHEHPAHESATTIAMK